jgi:hypothetical protein
MKSADENVTGVHIEPLNKKGLAHVLGVSVYILNKMLEDCIEDIGEPTGTMYSVKQVQGMIDKYGMFKK